MARRIEVVGPPGVGKSTLYQALRKKWRPHYSWTLQSEVLPKLEKPEPGMRNWFQYWLRRLLGSTPVDRHALQAAGMRFVKRNSSFSELCWMMIHKNRASNHQGVDMRLWSAHHFYVALMINQAVRESSTKNICIEEEGLIHRLFLLVDIDSSFESDTKQYCEMVPVPQGLIWCDTDPNEIARRAAERPETIPGHRGLSISELEEYSIKCRHLVEIAVHILNNKRGVKVLRLDMIRPVEENAIVAQRFVEALASAPDNDERNVLLVPYGGTNEVSDK